MQVNSTLSVKTFDVGPMLNIIYLIWDKKTKEAALVDPAWNLNAVLDFISYRRHDHDKTRQEPYAPIKLS